MNNFIKVLTLVLLTHVEILGQGNIDKLSFEKAMVEVGGDKAFIIIGEAHEVGGTYELENYVISEKAKEGYQSILYEGGVSEATLINWYLESGDVSVLNYTRARGKNYREFLKSIRHDSLGIRFKGIDFERGVCLEYLFASLFGNLKNTQIDAFINKLKEIDSKTSPNKIKNILLSAKSEYYKNEDLIKEVMGQGSKVIKQILDNPVFQADFGISSKKRDIGILKNLLEIPNEDLSKSILIIGSNHITNEKHFWKAFSNQKKEEIEGVVILLAYKNCTNYIRRKKYDSSKPLINYLEEYDSTEKSIKFKVIRNKQMGLLNEENKLIIAELRNQ
ncbi:hypothetical protein [Portibacter lacus]|uniref:Uncharacterized protein n=1 Tax=Portibacter lacus TaxID=1099794 RepID=A0AA37ST02_9BACT|nr:hypothetical protein [Portibacter lacus]GLR19069.1 hypothetical protein GCM10007940_36850 [Portibacter lacus]